MGHVGGTTRAIDPGGAVEGPAGPRRGSRRRALVTVLGIAATLLVLGILFSVLQATVRSTTVETVPVAASDAVEIDLPAADVLVTAEGDAGTLRAETSYFVRSPDVEVGAEPGVRRLDVSCGWPSSCDVDLSGTIPAGADATIRADRGDLAVEGSPGVVDLRTGGGDLRVEGPARDVRIASVDGEVTVIGVEGAVRAEAVAGDMELTGLSGPIRARSGEGVVVGEALTSKEVEVEGGIGGVRLRFAEPPDRVEVDVGEGPAEIAVPAGAYRIDADVNQGDLVVEGIVEDPDSQRRIVVRTLQGDATIEAT